MELLRMVDEMTSGTVTEINASGTSVFVRPGVLVGSADVRVQGGVIEGGEGRGVGYFLEALVCLAPFAKTVTTAVVEGVTSDDRDLSADAFRTVVLPLLEKFGVSDGVELSIKARGQPPLGGGRVVFRCAPVKALRSVRLEWPGRVRRVRGVVHVARVAPAMGARAMEAVRAELLPLCKNVYIYVDRYKGADSGPSPGFGCLLVAESDSGALLSAEACAAPAEPPEDLARRASERLLAEVMRGGAVDSAVLPLALLFMTISPEDVSTARVGKLSPHAIATLQVIDAVFGVRFRMEPDPETMTVLISCMGIGFSNIAKRAI